MDGFAQAFGYGSALMLIGGVAGYLIRLLIEHQLRRELESYKQTLSVLGKRLDFLHQERGKAALELVRCIKDAKSNLQMLVSPYQDGEVDQKQAWKDARSSYATLHNLIADYSFLFPKQLESRMEIASTSLWHVLAEAEIILADAQIKGANPFESEHFLKLSKRLRDEVNPIESSLIAQLRKLLNADADDADAADGDEQQ
ncbi:MAG: hypothetical protein ACF8MJ_01040 [Phycisphaerales bacterium JB050]